MTADPSDRIPLGKTNIMIPKIGLGIWAWGDRFLWDYGRDFDRRDVEGAWQAALEGELTLIDTAEVYGFGRSEQILGELLSRPLEEIQIATKFMPYPWRFTKGQLERALQGSLRRLGVDFVELYQIHHPLPFRQPEFWLEAMAEQQQRGRIGAIGVSNFNLAQTKSAVATLAEFDLPLASNQMEYSLLDRTIEYSGLLDYCQQRKITLIAYSPLAQGLLTGKYSQDNPPPGARGRRVNEKTWQRLNPLLAAMERMGHDHGGRSLAQVALNWVVAKGAVPIPGAKTKKQASENAGALGWGLTKAEVAELDELSDFKASE